MREFCAGFASGAPTKPDLMRFEEGVRADLDAIGREAMKRAFKAADFDDAEVWINGVQHPRSPLHRHGAHVVRRGGDRADVVPEGRREDRR